MASFGMILIPLVFLVLIVGGCLICNHVRWSRQRRRLRLEAERSNREAEEAARGVHGSHTPFGGEGYYAAGTGNPQTDPYSQLQLQGPPIVPATVLSTTTPATARGGGTGEGTGVGARGPYPLPLVPPSSSAVQAVGRVGYDGVFLYDPNALGAAAEPSPVQDSFIYGEGVYLPHAPQEEKNGELADTTEPTGEARNDGEATASYVNNETGSQFSEASPPQPPLSSKKDKHSS